MDLHTPTTPASLALGGLDAWLGLGLSLVSIGDKASQLLPKATRRKVKKKFSLLPLDLQAVRVGGSGVICCGVVGEGSQFF